MMLFMIIINHFLIIIIIIERKETQIALVNYPAHVEYMHSNNDTMFSHEYAVSVGLLMVFIVLVY